MTLSCARARARAVVRVSIPVEWGLHRFLLFLFLESVHNNPASEQCFHYTGTNTSPPLGHTNTNYISTQSCTRVSVIFRDSYTFTHGVRMLLHQTGAFCFCSQKENKITSITCIRLLFMSQDKRRGSAETNVPISLCSDALLNRIQGHFGKQKWV